MALKATQIKSLRDGRHADGEHGLYLNVDKGSRSWVQRLTIHGRRRWFGLGSAKLVTLAEARAMALDNRRTVLFGGDPIADRKRAKTIPTFAEAGERYIALHRGAWKSGSRNESNWRSSLAHAATIGHRPVSDIATHDVIAVLLPVYQSKPATGKALRQRMRAIFEWARAAGHRQDNPADERIEAALPRTSAKVTHRAAVDHRSIAAILSSLDAIESRAWAGKVGAFKLAVLTACRTAEVLGAKWNEIGMTTATWTIPAARMKASRDHRVPLSSSAMVVLRAAHKRTRGKGLVFRACDGKRALDQASLREVVRKIEMHGTVHGFRSCFRDWCSETGVDRATAEWSLAHVFQSDTERAYARSDLLELRRPVMQAWADHVNGTA